MPARHRSQPPVLVAEPLVHPSLEELKLQSRGSSEICTGQDRHTVSGDGEGFRRVVPAVSEISLRWVARARSEAMSRFARSAGRKAEPSAEEQRATQLSVHNRVAYEIVSNRSLAWKVVGSRGDESPPGQSNSDSSANGTLWRRAEQTVRSARPDILFYDEHVIDLYQRISALYRMG